MKRIVGLILLALALLGAVGVVKQFARGDSARPLGSSAYESGRKAGKYTAALLVLVLGGAGVALLFSERRAGTPPPVPGAPGIGTARASKPWYRTTGGIIGLAVAGGALGLVVLVMVIAVAGSLAHRRHGAPPPGTYSAAPSPASRAESELTQTGPFSVGARAEAHWAGRWIPGKITRVNPGGFSVMIQLEDGRFPTPIVLSTNQIRVE